MTENFRMLARDLTESQSKFLYFQLAAAGASIAVSVNQTLNDAINWLHVSWVIAVFSWGASVLFGMRAISARNNVLAVSTELMKVELGEHEAFGNDIERAKPYYMKWMQARTDYNGQLEKFARRQTYLVYTGGTAYIVWHLSNMVVMRFGDLIS